MGFFQDSNRVVTQSKSEVLAESCSQRLYNALLSTGKAQPKPEHIKSWSKAFLLLLKHKGENGLLPVLDWYISHIKDEFVPQAYSGDGFRQKYDAILKAMETSDDIPAEKIDARYVKLANKLANSLTYPVQITACLPVIAQRSADRWSEFSENMEVVALKRKKEREERFVSEIENNYGQLFVENWLELIGIKYGHLICYTGPVLGLAFKADNKNFRQFFWLKWSAEWSGDPTAFLGLLNAIIKGD